ncbi:fungal-specific transcription factor domain-containing protein [Colletotrichum navitas]|uniref:Fungal-specific transcription factor domain-containing protein n=1 Tax=Colletotrichum navitas TaxID=681940 RepID=A0AAD8PNH9_9PEZI|nr:fungal-specific transcription factor domain-containing protein [Colletotrichum navitas]KAK1573421.1 fungal-specific transcription factor domain-containing protein [Colletotrichum navitas]
MDKEPHPTPASSFDLRNRGIATPFLLPKPDLPQTIPSATGESPFSALIFPFAVSSASPALMNALLGLSASHRARTDKTYEPVALSYSAKVIRSLRLTLENKSSIDIAANSEILVLVMLLCQLEIIAECDKRWVTHLRWARDLIRFRRQAMGSDVVKMEDHAYAGLEWDADTRVAELKSH